MPGLVSSINTTITPLFGAKLSRVQVKDPKNPADLSNDDIKLFLQYPTGSCDKNLHFDRIWSRLKSEPEYQKTFAFYNSEQLKHISQTLNLKFEIQNTLELLLQYLFTCATKVNFKPEICPDEKTAHRLTKKLAEDFDFEPAKAHLLQMEVNELIHQQAYQQALEILDIKAPLLGIEGIRVQMSTYQLLTQRFDIPQEYNNYFYAEILEHAIALQEEDVIREMQARLGISDDIIEAKKQALNPGQSITTFRPN